MQGLVGAPDGADPKLSLVDWNGRAAVGVGDVVGDDVVQLGLVGAGGGGQG